jgi:serine/threonine protein kinase
MEKQAMVLVQGSRVGSYEIVARIGAGGMGEVFRAHDTRLNRDVAIKVLPAAFAHDRERVARFRREAQVVASLNHPNIAAIYGLEEANGVAGLALELVEGEDLAERLARGPVPSTRPSPSPGRSPRGSRRRTRRASSIATSSPRTSKSPATAA